MERLKPKFAAPPAKARMEQAARDVVIEAPASVTDADIVEMPAENRKLGLIGMVTGAGVIAATWLPELMQDLEQGKEAVELIAYTGAGLVAMGAKWIARIRGVIGSLALLALLALPAYGQYPVVAERTGNTATLIVTSTWHDMEVREGSWLCVHGDRSDHCYGSRTMEPENFAITAWGDNSVTTDVKDGFGVGERIRVKAFDPVLGVELGVVPVYESGPEVYEVNGISVLENLRYDDADIVALLDSLDQMATSLMQELEDLADAAQEAWDARDAAIDERDDAIASIEPLHQEIAALESQLAQGAVEIESLSAERNQLIEDLEASEANRQALSQNINILQDNLAAAQDLITQAEAERDDALAEVEPLEAEVQRMMNREATWFFRIRALGDILAP